MGKAKLKKPEHPKERNLLKACIRRVFSRSELRKQVIEASIIEHSDIKRPKVKTWCRCDVCGQPEAKSYMECDHLEPLIPLHLSLEDLTWDQVVARAWCDISNLRATCKPCHKKKTKAENKERRRLKKERNK